MPGTGGMTIGMQGRTPLVARAGGGVYVAYPAPQAQDRVRVWRVGASNAPIVVRKRGSGPVTIAAARDGRLWLVWDDRGSVDAQIRARALEQGRDEVGRGGRGGPPEEHPAGLPARRERRRRRARRARRLQPRDEQRREHLPPPPAARPDADRRPGPAAPQPPHERELHGPRRRRSGEGRQGRGGRRLRDDQPPRQGGAHPARARGEGDRDQVRLRRREAALRLEAR